MSFRNRCVIAGGGGPVNLSIPLVDGRNQRRPSNEVRIDNKTDWQGQHWKTITSCYNRSPWFEFYKHDLEILYQQPAEQLYEWNRKCWDWVVGKLGLEIETKWSKGPVKTGQIEIPGSEKGAGKGVGENGEIGIPGRSGADSSVVDVTGVEPVSRHMSDGSCTKALYLDWRNKLLPKSIATDFPEPIRYRQVFEDRTGFLPHLSILDLLFCEGPRTVEILESAKIPI